MASDLDAKKILVIDDEQEVRTFLVALLEHFGYQCYQAENGQLGIQVFEAHKSKIGMAIVDMCMPVMDGKETLKILHQLNEDLPVLMISGYSEQHIRAETDGYMGFLSKPFAAQDLKSYVDKAF